MWWYCFFVIQERKKHNQDALFISKWKVNLILMKLFFAKYIKTQKVGHILLAVY